MYMSSRLESQHVFETVVVVIDCQFGRCASTCPSFSLTSSRHLVSEQPS
jgi:hypothetical protein